MLRISREGRDALIFLLPYFAFLGFFIIYPMISGFYYSLNNVHLSDLKFTFIGLGNYVRILSDKVFAQALTQTLIYVSLHTVVGVPLGLGIALLLNQEFRGRSVARVCLLIPWATPPIVCAMMFSIFLHPYYGTINYTMQWLGLVPQEFRIFSNPQIALFGLVIVSMWKSAPLFAFIFLSGLQALPTEILESAKVYGASSFAVFRKIILPYLKPTLAVNCILSGFLALAGTQAFDLVIGITHGGPGYNTYMLYFLSYTIAFPWNLLGYGATIAWVVTIISVIFALVLLKLWYKRIY